MTNPPLNNIQEIRALILWLLPDGAFKDRSRGWVHKRAWRTLGYRVGIHPGLLKLYWRGLPVQGDDLETLRTHAVEVLHDVALSRSHAPDASPS